MIDTFFAVGIWIVLSISFLRAWKQGQLEKFSAQMMWAIFVLMAFAFLFRTKAAAYVIDQHFEGIPVAYWFKLLSIITAEYLYLKVLQRVQPPTRSSYQWLGYLAVLNLIGNTITLGLGLQGTLTPHQVYYAMMSFSDFVTLLYMSLMFLPVNYYLLQKEQLEPLRLKHVATIVFSAFYIPATALPTIFAPVALFTGYTSPLLSAVPVAPIVFVCIIVQLLPYRYIQKLFYLERLYLYYKLRKLEFTVLTLAGKESQLSGSINPLNGQALEEATYVALIGILDYSNEAAKHSAKGRVIYEKVMTATEYEADYSTLVKAIARVAA